MTGHAIRTLIVDDHPAVRNGLVAALRAEPGIMPVATASGVVAAIGQAKRSRTDVALVDRHLDDGDGLALCHELELMPSAPAVLIYSASAGPELRLAASVAGADGLVGKGAPLGELFDAIRTVASGGKALPPLRPRAVERLVSRLDSDDLPILGLRLDGVPLPEIASVLHLSEREVSRRVIGMLGRLTAWPGSTRYMDEERAMGSIPD